MPRLVEQKYGPVLARAYERQGIYEFVNPVLRLSVNLRELSRVSDQHLSEGPRSQ